MHDTCKARKTRTVFSSILFYLNYVSVPSTDFMTILICDMESREFMTLFTCIQNDPFANATLISTQVVQIIQPPREKKAPRTFHRINISVRMPGPNRCHRLSFLAEVSPWSITDVSEQRRFRGDCADAQAPLNLCCSHML